MLSPNYLIISLYHSLAAFLFQHPVSAKDFRDGLSSLNLGIFRRVDVRVDREGCVRMPESIGNEPGVDSRRGHQRSGRMPKCVEAHVTELRSGGDALEPLQDSLGIDRFACLFTEDEVVVGPGGACS